jgi:CheY-like chemotaxis protein
MKDIFADAVPANAPASTGIFFGSAYLSANEKDGMEFGALPAGIAREEKHPFALVVDDTPDVLQMLAVVLRHNGYDVVTALSAMDALEAAQCEQFDVVVSDIGMPGMDGYSLATALREMPAYQTVPLVAVTGYAMYDDRERAISSGFDAHLTKPINPEALLDLLAKLRQRN